VVWHVVFNANRLSLKYFHVWKLAPMLAPDVCHAFELHWSYHFSSLNQMPLCVCVYGIVYKYEVMRVVATLWWVFLHVQHKLVVVFTVAVV